MDWMSLQPRFLRDGVPIRLGGIATNLARIASFSRHPVNRDAVEQMVIQSRLFIEWTLPDMNEDAAVLSELEAQLAQWQGCWGTLWEDAEERQAVIDQSRRWSERILGLSGLLDEGASRGKVA
jgi:hypothetical protein